MMHHVGNVLPPYEIQGTEVLGEPKQVFWIDPVVASRLPEGEEDFVHEGPTVEELKQDGFVGLYIPAKDMNNAVEKRYFEHKIKCRKRGTI